MSQSRPSHNCCNNYTRSQLLRSRRRRGRQGPAGDRAGDAGAGRHRALAAQLPLAQRRAGAGRLRRLEDPALGLRGRGSRRRRRATRSSSRSSSTAASTRSACWPRSATRNTRTLRPNLALAPKAKARAFSEDPSLRWHPAAAGAGDPARRGQGQRLPGDRLRPPRPVALHLAPLLRDRRARRSASAPAGSAATSTRSATTRTRCRGSRWTASLSPMIATAEQAGGGDRQRRRLRPLVGGLPTRCAARCSRASPASARCPPTRPGLAQVRRATAQTDKLRQDLGGVGEFTSPVAYPDTCFAHKLAGLAAYIAVGLPMRVVTIRAAGRLRHPRRPGRRPRPQPARDLRGRARLPARPRGARARRPGDDRDVERVRAAAGGERLGRDRPRRRRLRLRDRLESQRRDGRRVPRPGDSSTSTTTCA